MAGRRVGARKVRAGNAAIEYALLLALIVAGVLFAVEATRLGMSHRFGKIAGVLQGDDARALAGVSAAHRASLQSRQTPVMGDRWNWWGVAGVSCGAAAFCLQAWNLAHRRRRAAEESAVEDDEPLLHPARASLFVKRQEILRIIGANLHGMLESQLLVEHVMTRKLLTIPEETPIAELQQIMEQHHGRHLLVCNGSGKLLGIISDRDLQRQGRTAAELMTRHPATAAPGMEIVPAVTLMMSRKISCLPVVADGVLCGVLTATDLMMTLQCTLQLLRRLTAELSPLKSDAAIGASADIAAPQSAE